MRLTLLTILTALAPTLTTLSLCINGDPKLPSLPVLTELTLSYGIGYCSLGKSLRPRTYTPLPSLRRLDLLGLTLHLHVELEEMAAEAARLAPNMTHICLPVIRTAKLQDVIPAADSPFWARVGLGGGALVALQIQLDPCDKGAEMHTLSSDEWGRRRRVFSREAVRRPGLVFCAREKVLDESSEEQQENWRARIVGGAGRWVHWEEAGG